MSQRHAVTKVRARVYVRDNRITKTRILDELVELTKWRWRPWYQLFAVMEELEHAMETFAISYHRDRFR